VPERIVLDTNVLVSALLVQGSVPDQVLDTVLSGTSRLLLDGRIVREYRAVLARPEFGFDPALVEDVLLILSDAEWIVPHPLKLTLPDPSDLPFIEVAIGAGADAIVTGNPKHFKPREGWLEALPVLSPRQFLGRLRDR
jgi:putative PIN family toxin of toxin-antitoxin system